MNKKYTPSVNRRAARPRSKRLQAVGGTYTMIKNTGISGSSESAKIDTSMSDTSENAVANKVIKRYVDTVRSYFEGKVPRQILIDITSVLPSATINRQIRDELYNIFTYTEGDDITTDPAWVIDTNRQHYIIKMLETETGVGFYIIGYEGLTRIEGDNTKTNQLLWDKADKKYADETFFSQAHFVPAKTHDYVKSYYNYRNESPKTLELGIDLVIQDDIEAADEENDNDLQNGIFHNGLVTAMGVKKYVDSKMSSGTSKLYITEGSTEALLAANIFYEVEGCVSELAITLSPVLSAYTACYHIRFKTSDVQPNVTIDGVQWLYGYNILEHLDPNTTYEISIVEGLAVGGAF